METRRTDWTYDELKKYIGWKVLAKRYKDEEEYE
jgi:hypothetical protein